MIQAYIFAIIILKFKPGTTWKCKELFFLLLSSQREMILFQGQPLLGLCDILSTSERKEAMISLPQVPGRHKNSKTPLCAHSRGKTLEQMVVRSSKNSGFNWYFL